MRGKRAEYSEGIFGQIKWNMGFKRFLLRGLDKVDLEWGLLCFALNIKRINKKDIEKLKEIAMVKAVSWVPISGHPLFCLIELYKLIRHCPRLQVKWDDSHKVL